jgi:hypothetical protein
LINHIIEYQRFGCEPYFLNHTGVAFYDLNLESTIGIRIGTYSSVISGDAGNDEHEVECDYKLNNKGLQIGSRWHCSCEVILIALKK